MRIKVLSTVNLLDHTKRRGDDWVKVEPGEYEMDEVPNPKGGDRPWLVIKGTTTGASKGALESSKEIRILG